MAPVTPVIACTYAEIALKGRNRKMFLRKLINNINGAVKGLPVSAVRHVESRLLVFLDDPSQVDAVAARLKNVFGIQWLSPVAVVPRSEVDGELREDLGAEREPALTRLCETAVAMAEAGLSSQDGEARHFKVDTRRSDRSFPLDSPAINRLVGGAVHQGIGLPGRMSHPDLVVNVLVLKDDVLVFTGKEPAYGGLPFASSGRSMVLLSGGIDSPVAAWLMMRRGSRPDFVHFFSGRTVEEGDTDKIVDLARILARYAAAPMNLHLVPVVPYEMRAIGNVPDSFDMVMFRRYMFKTAAALARRCGARFAILDCRAPMSVLRSRVERRAQRADEASEATVEVLDRQRREGLSLIRFGDGAPPMDGVSATHWRGAFALNDAGVADSSSVLQEYVRQGGCLLKLVARVLPDVL